MPEFAYPLIGIPLIFVCTTLGALFVFFIHKKEISPRLNKIFMGFAAGVMFSASFFSLIKPALGHRMGILGCSTTEMKMSLGC